MDLRENPGTGSNTPLVYQSQTLTHYLSYPKVHVEPSTAGVNKVTLERRPIRFHFTPKSIKGRMISNWGLMWTCI